MDGYRETDRRRGNERTAGERDANEWTVGERLPVVVGWTGASGVVYGVRLVEVLLRCGVDVRLIISAAAQIVLREELNLSLAEPLDTNGFMAALQPTISVANGVDSGRDQAEAGGETEPSLGRLTLDAWDDPAAEVASGSFRTHAMVICPCSMATLGAIASGAGRNLIHRVAEVHLKERRPLVFVPRETPLSLIALRNMVTLTEAGAVMLPASPGFHGNCDIRNN